MIDLYIAHFITMLFFPGVPLPATNPTGKIDLMPFYVNIPRHNPKLYNMYVSVGRQCSVHVGSPQNIEADVSLQINIRMIHL